MSFSTPGKGWGLLVSMIAMTLMVSACQTNKEVAGPPILNGNWASSDGVYVAEFKNGKFTAIANDTGGVISEGNYIAKSESQVSLSWYGVVSGKSGSADCLKSSPDQLDCVDTNGNKFSLKRSSS